MAVTVCKFSRFFGRACPQTPLKSLLERKLLNVNTAEKKLRLKK